MIILYTGFNGKNNSSKILLDKINANNKLYLRNSFVTSVESLKKELIKNLLLILWRVCVSIRSKMNCSVFLNF